MRTASSGPLNGRYSGSQTEIANMRLAPRSSDVRRSLRAAGLRSASCFLEYVTDHDQVGQTRSLYMAKPLALHAPDVFHARRRVRDCRAVWGVRPYGSARL